MNTSRKRMLLGAGLLIAAGAVYGCDDFLVSPPKGTLDEVSLANKDGVEAALVAAYRMLDGSRVVFSWGAAASNWALGSVPSDDAYKGSDPADQAPITDLELYNWGTGGAESYLNGKWRQVYEGINRANSTLRLLARVQEESPGELSDAAANSIRGEALFLRAHYHFEGWKVWGNIPYYTEDDTDFREANTPADQVVTMILADLDQAIGLLPATPRDAGRAGQWTAKAYKGRVQVYAGDHAGGLATLREVVGSGVYALEPDFTKVWTGFSAFANGPETILAYQASANDGNSDGDNANWGERLNFPHAGSHFGCCGFHQPSQNLVNYYRVDAGGLPLALSNGAWNASDAEFDAAASASVAVDPRLDWTVGRDEVPYKDWGAHEASWIRDPGHGGPYSPKKHVHEKASGAESKVGWVPSQLNSVNIHIFRYADLLLLLAEAEVESGSLENARQLVNRVRARAGVVAQGPGTSADNMAVPIDDPSITWADYRVGQYASFPSKEYARQAVRAERRLELAMEGHRFFDLRRWGTAQQVLSDYLAVERNRRSYLSGASAYTDRHKYYPIPPVQIELSEVNGEGRLQQNAGW